MSYKIKLTLIVLLLFFSCTYFFACSSLFSSKASPTASDGALAEDKGLIKDDGKVLAAGLGEKDKSVDSRENSEVNHSEQRVTEEAVTEEQLEPPPANTYLPDQESNDVIWDEKLVDQLTFLQSPIPGANISSRDSQLPGAPRAYRNGTHEGLDYYQGYCGVTIHFGDPVYTAGAGIVIRVDHDYMEPTIPEREEFLQLSAAEGDTPEHILDKLRGRQVWVSHAFGVVTRYAHLDTVSENIEVGDWIEAGR